MKVIQEIEIPDIEKSSLQFEHDTIKFYKRENDIFIMVEVDNTGAEFRIENKELKKLCGD